MSVNQAHKSSYSSSQTKHQSCQTASQLPIDAVVKLSITTKRSCHHEKNSQPSSAPIPSRAFSRSSPPRSSYRLLNPSPARGRLNLHAACRRLSCRPSRQESQASHQCTTSCRLFRLRLHWRLESTFDPAPISQAPTTTMLPMQTHPTHSRSAEDCLHLTPIAVQQQATSRRFEPSPPLQAHPVYWACPCLLLPRASVAVVVDTIVDPNRTCPKVSLLELP
jgi:hypothetical protein